MDTDTRERLLEQFRAALDTLPDTPEADETGRRTDLYSLFAELVALKNEVRLESRQVKTALDEFRAVFETLQASQTQLGGELERLTALKRVNPSVRDSEIEAMAFQLDALRAALPQARVRLDAIRLAVSPDFLRLVAG